MDNRPTANEASSALAEAIDDFLGDLERKFKTVSDEILTKRESPRRLAEYFSSDSRSLEGDIDSKLAANVTRS
jgi:hypothetical protein